MQPQEDLRELEVPSGKRLDRFPNDTHRHPGDASLRLQVVTSSNVSFACLTVCGLSYLGLITAAGSMIFLPLFEDSIGSAMRLSGFHC